MSWVRIDDKAWQHDKVASLSAPALRLWLFALCRCNQYETDGAISKAALRLLGGTPKQVAELVDTGLWEVADGGWRVHDYLVYQPSKAELAEHREHISAVRSAAGKRGAAARHAPKQAAETETSKLVANRLANGQQTSGKPVATIEQTGSPNPSQPVPSQPNPEGEQSTRALDGGSDDHETTCPLNLVEKAQKAGVFGHMLTKMPGVVPEQLESKAREFVSYWTIGAGTGQKRRQWLRKLREDLRRAHEQNRLTPIGALEHAANDGLADKFLAAVRASEARR